MRLFRADRPKGLSANGLRVWGYMFLLLGIAGQSLIQNRILGMGDLGSGELFAVLDSDPDMMIYATVALLCQAVQTCAIPIFAMLTVEGFLHTHDLTSYLVRVFAVAVLSELPYNLAMGGRLLDLSSRNPVFSVLLCLVTLMLYSRFEGKGLKNFAIKAVITVAALVWANMLQIQEGGPMVVMCATFWAIRNRPNYRNLAGLAGACVCTLFSMYYLAAPMGMMALYMYNEEQGEQNRIANYCAYPVLLAVFAAGAMFL